MAVASAAGAAPASARAVTAGGRPTAGKAPLGKLIGQPVRNVKTLVSPAGAVQKPGRAALPAGKGDLCPASQPGHATCTAALPSSPSSAVKNAKAKTAAGKTSAAAAAAPSGYSPAQLQSAYGLTAASAAKGYSGNAPEVVAITTADDDPAAASDLAQYRAGFGMLPCISTSTLAGQYSLPLGSGCLSKVNENNQASPLPAALSSGEDDGWLMTDSDQIDMVTAICPNCEILLVEADSDSLSDLGQSVVTAENDSDFISNAWGYSPAPSGISYWPVPDTSQDKLLFDAPGKAIVFPGNTTWPASSQYVTAVGGTTLTADSSASRGWDETAWTGGASGCSQYGTKASWQTPDDTSPAGCLNRTQNDVAAVADPGTPVAIYDSADSSTGWDTGSDTAVSTAIIAAVYALNGLPQAGTYPASYPYQSGSSGDFYDITSGSDGTCESNRQYLCTAGTGFDGPTGVGTPDGAAGLSYRSSGDTVTVIDPGTENFTENQQISLPLQASSSDSSQAITWTASGLPPSLAINSATGTITGTAPAASGTSAVTVTAADAAGGSGSVTFNIDSMAPLDSGWTAASGPFASAVSGMCLDDPAGNTAAGTAIHVYACNSGANQNWIFRPSGAAGGAGQITPAAATGMCLTMSGFTSGSTSTLQACSASNARQKWRIEEQNQAGFLNPQSGLCLTDPGSSTTNNTQLDLGSCDWGGLLLGQGWDLPAGQILSSGHGGAGGKCLDDYQASAANNAIVDNYACNGTGAQNWTLTEDQAIEVQGMCLDMKSQSKLDGGLAELYTCNDGDNQKWVPLPGGELMNLNSGKCLDDTTGSGGTQLEQEDCYSQPGEIWEET